MKRKALWVLLPIAGICAILAGAVAVYTRGRPPQIPTREKLYNGITYTRSVRLSPRPLMLHVITVDTRGTGARVLVTPPDDRDGQYPLRARTTSEFLDEFEMQVAINGDGFSPWWSRGVADYYPHEGDPVAPRGTTASRGKLYWTSQAAVPTLYVSSRTTFSFEAPARPFNAISGETLLVMGGNLLPDLDDSITQPRSAIGYSRNGRYLYLVVVDGRQPFYSEGMTVQELARLMASLGAEYAMNLDGGGSSTLVMRDARGHTRVLNSPIDNYIPGRERPVANHVGIYIER
jgi:hypothetical protein